MFLGARGLTDGAASRRAIGAVARRNDRRTGGTGDRVSAANERTEIRTAIERDDPRASATPTLAAGGPQSQRAVAGLHAGGERSLPDIDDGALVLLAAASAQYRAAPTGRS
jgi:hypothetical protein